MTCYLEINYADGRVEKRRIKPGGHIGTADGECPGCGVTPFLVQGSDRRIYDREIIIANGRCKDCGDAVGFIYARTDTLFGLEEDRAVLEFGRARVYR